MRHLDISLKKKSGGRQFNSRGRVSIISQTAWVPSIFTLCQFCDCKMVNGLSLASCAQTKTLKVERKAVFSLSASVIGKKTSPKCSLLTSSCLFGQTWVTYAPLEQLMMKRNSIVMIK